MFLLERNEAGIRSLHSTKCLQLTSGSACWVYQLLLRPALKHTPSKAPELTSWTVSKSGDKVAANVNLLWLASDLIPCSSLSLCFYSWTPVKVELGSRAYVCFLKSLFFFVLSQITATGKPNWRWRLPGRGMALWRERAGLPGTVLGGHRARARRILNPRCWVRAGAPWDLWGPVLPACC